MALLIIFGIAFVCVLSYTIADFAYYMGYDRAWTIVLNEWQKDIEAASEHTSDEDNDIWEIQMIKIDKSAEISDRIGKEADKVQLNRVLKEWWNGRKRSKRVSKKPPVQTDIEHKAAN